MSAADVYLYCMEQVSSNDITRTKIFSSSTLSVTVILSFQLISVLLWLRIVFTVALCALVLSQCEFYVHTSCLGQFLMNNAAWSMTGGGKVKKKNRKEVIEHQLKKKEIRLDRD
jgi:hypothetical protein